METDPIAENQTNVMIAKLTTRTEGDVELSHAVAALLAAAQKQARETMEIKSSLWSPDALDRRIDSRFAELCRMCPTRAYVAQLEAERLSHGKSDASRAKAQWWQLVLSKDGLLILIVLMFALMCMYTILGQQGYKDVTHTLQKDTIVRQN